MPTQLDTVLRGSWGKNSKSQGFLHRRGNLVKQTSIQTSFEPQVGWLVFLSYFLSNTSKTSFA